MKSRYLFINEIQCKRWDNPKVGKEIFSFSLNFEFESWNYHQQDSLFQIHGVESYIFKILVNDMLSSKDT